MKSMSAASVTWSEKIEHYNRLKSELHCRTLCLSSSKISGTMQIIAFLAILLAYRDKPGCDIPFQFMNALYFRQIYCIPSSIS